MYIGKTRTKDKYRIVYTELQKVELEKEFLYNQYITIQRKAELAASIGLSDRQVKIWFQNRRAKERKHKKQNAGAAASRLAGQKLLQPPLPKDDAVLRCGVGGVGVGIHHDSAAKATVKLETDHLNMFQHRSSFIPC